MYIYIYICICVYEESYQYNAASKGNVELQTRIFGLPRPQLHRSPAGSWTGGCEKLACAKVIKCAMVKTLGFNGI